MAAPSATQNPLSRPEIRCAAATYATLAAACGLTAMSIDPNWVPLATVLLLPVALVGGFEAVRTAGRLWREWRATQLGANVKRALASLGSSYRVVTRGSPVPSRDSHVAIGPNGVFLVLSSDDGGRVTASDQRLFVNARVPWRNIVEDCRVEALRVSDRVQRALGRPVPVHAVLCFTRALVAVGQEIRGVKIVQVPRLARLVASIAAPAPLSADEIAMARAALVANVSSVAPLRPVFRLTRRRRTPVRGERPFSIVGRTSTTHQSRS
jgi:hypothetical protein